MENAHPAGKRELLFAVACALCSMLLVNATLFGGCNLGFAVAVTVSIVCAAGYLLINGAKPTAYSRSILVLSLIIAGSFARSDDNFVKFVMVCFLLVSVNLGLCLLAGKNRRNPGSAASLADAGFALFNMGFGELPASTCGLTNAFRSSGALGQKGGAVLLGLGFAIPVLLIIIPLLMAADAAFEGLLDMLPAFNVGEFLTTLFFGLLGACILYTRATALRFFEKEKVTVRERKGLPALTVNTLLVSVVLVYLVYLASQLAYFVGGFSGILPAEYTLAEYARRGFFEMAALCGVNLGIMVFSLSLCKDGAPKSTRLLCLFLGAMTVFFLSTASAKMLMYIGSYGLTRLRVLTQVIMVFMGLVTILVSVWLFVPKLAYMKAVVLLALVMGAAVSWADVDTQVAKFNTDAYLTGRMQQIDMTHMGSLGSGALPHIYQLSVEAEDPLVRHMAEDLLNHWEHKPKGDIRSWNYVNHRAKRYVPVETAPEPEASEPLLIRENGAYYLLLGMDGVMEFVVSTPYSSGGCVNADGSLFAKGEQVWLEQLDRLDSASITALGQRGETLWVVSFPEGMENKEHILLDDWIVYLK